MAQDEILDISRFKKPYYNWAAELEIGRFSPTGLYGELLAPAFWINFKGHYNPGWTDYFLWQGELGFISGKMKYNSNQEYHLLPLGLLASYQYPLGPEFRVEAHAGGGGYYFFLNQETYQNFYGKAGAALVYQLDDKIQLKAGVDFLYFYDSRQSIKAWGWSGALAYYFGEPLTEKDVKVGPVEIKDLFAAFYPGYQSVPMGSLTLQNTASEALKEIQVSVFVKEFMQEKSASLQEVKLLKPGGKAVIPLYFLFDQSVGTQKQDIYTTALLEIVYYKSSGKKFVRRDTVPIQIWGRNALVWDDPERLGAFSTFQDEVIVNFTRSLTQNRELWAHESRISLGQDGENLLLIYEGLRQYGLTYTKDPNQTSAAAFQGLIRDYIQFPRETLARRTGDCDDLMVLLAASLESVGIKTAYVILNDHVFLLVEAGSLGISDKAVSYQNRRWLPLEPTVIREGLVASWIKGYEEWQKSERRKIVPFQKAVSQYPPLTLSDSVFEISPLDKEALKTGYRAQLASMADFLSREKEGKDEDSNGLNKRGVKEAMAGNYAGAEELLLKALKKDPGNRKVYYNLLILYRLSVNLNKAESIFAKLNQRFPSDALGHLLLSRVYLALKDYQRAQKYYELALGFDKNLEDQDYSKELLSQKPKSRTDGTKEWVVEDKP